jgi:hypothetical protein
MKYGVVVLLLLVLPMVAFSQNQPNNLMIDYSNGDLGYEDVTYTNSMKDSTFILFPNIDGTYYISQTFPTVSSDYVETAKRFSAEGAAYLCFEPNNVSGSGGTLAHWIKPIIWDVKDQEFAIIKHDSTFLTFDTKGVYVSSSEDATTLVSGREYGCTLSGELWAVAGFAVYGRHAGTAVDIATYWLSLTR